MNRAAITLSLWCAATATAVAGPFGIEGGMSLEALKAKIRIAASDTPGAYFSDYAPEMHHAFQQYIYIVSPKFGLCKVMAVSKPQTNIGDYRSVFSELAASLVTKYGEPSTKLPFLTGTQSDAVKPDFFTALRNETIKIEFMWDVADLPKKLPENLGVIALQAASMERGEGTVLLSYQFSRECVTDVQGKRDSAL